MEGASFDEFLRRPFGRYLLGDHHLLWCATPHRAGTVVWGRGDEAEARQMVRGWDFSDHLATPYDSVVDLSGMTSVDSAAFDVVLRDMSARLPTLAQRVRRQALVRPVGLPGAVVAGFYPPLRPGFEWRDFSDREAAFAWCMPDDPALAREVASLVDGARQATPLVARLRHLLRADVTRGHAIADVARALAVSTRTLQRELTLASTSFRAELQRARVDAATTLLADTDLKLEAIARKVGCASVPSFATLFRRLTGEQPTAYRHRVRGQT